MDSISVSLYGEYAEYLESLKYIFKNGEKNGEKIDNVVVAINRNTTQALEADIRTRLTDLVYILSEPGDKFFIGTVDLKVVDMMLRGSIYTALENICKYLNDILEDPMSDYENIEAIHNRDHILAAHAAVKDMMKELGIKIPKTNL